MLMIVSSNSAPNASGVRDCEVEIRIKYPRPWSEPTNSPITPPMTAKVIAILKPTKICGIAVGNLILMKVWYCVAESERMRSNNGGGTADRPEAVATTIGKKQTRKTTRTFGRTPKPIQSTSNGAIATFGMDCSASRIGYIVFCRNGE